MKYAENMKDYPYLWDLEKFRNLLLSLIYGLWDLGKFRDLPSIQVLGLGKILSSPVLYIASSTQKYWIWHSHIYVDLGIWKFEIFCLLDLGNFTEYLKTWVSQTFVAFITQLVAVILN